MTSNVPPASKRIQRRLRTQHARWLVRQPMFHSWWFRLQRRVGGLLWKGKRKFFAAFNWFSAAPGIYVLTLALLLLALYAVQAISQSDTMASFLRFLSSPDTAVNVRIMATLAVASTFWIVEMLAAVFGAERSIGLNARYPRSQRMTLIRVLDRKSRFRLKVFRIQLIAFTALSLLLLMVALASFSSSILAITMGTLATFATSWLIRKLGLRLMRIRLRAWGGFTIAEAMWLLSLMLIYATMLEAVSKSSPTIEAIFPWFGPSGWMHARLLAVAQGDWLAAFLIAIYSIVTVVTGNFLGRDVGTWANRRKLIESQRLALTVKQAKPTDVSQPTESQLQDEIRRGRERTSDKISWIPKRVLASLYQPIRGSAYVVGAFVFGAQLLVMWLESTLHYGDDIDMTSANGIRVDVLMNTLLALPVVFVFCGLEWLMLFKRHTQSMPLNSRLLTTWGHWHRVQLDFFVRLPKQVVCVAPFAFVWLISTADASAIAGPIVVALIGFGLFSRTLFASFNVVESINSVAWLQALLRVVLLYAGVASLLYGSSSLFVIGTETISSHTHIAIVVIANIMAIGGYAVLARLRKNDTAAIFKLIR